MRAPNWTLFLIFPGTFSTPYPEKRKSNQNQRLAKNTTEMKRRSRTSKQASKQASRQYGQAKPSGRRCGQVYYLLFLFFSFRILSFVASRIPAFFFFFRLATFSGVFHPWACRITSSNMAAHYANLEEQVKKEKAEGKTCLCAGIRASFLLIDRGRRSGRRGGPR